MGYQRLDFVAEIYIVSAGSIQKGAARGRIDCEYRYKDVFNLLPSRSTHWE